MARSRALDGFPEGFRGRIGETPEEIERFGRDASPDIGHPAAAVAPADAEDVAILVRWARAHRRPLVARGGGTSLEGSAVPPDGGVVVDFSGWTSIGPVDAMSRTVEVGPGVLNRDLHAHLQPDRLFFPPNPGSWTTSTIGGNVATNASGPRSLRYGATRRWVRELEVVLGTGERLRLGSPLAKRSVGPDLLGLLVGSEGTLGLVTSVRLDLAGSPARRAGLVVPIPPSAPLGRFARGLVGARDLGLSALEYLDGPSATELSREVGSRLPGGAPLLLAEIESADEESEGRALERFATTLRALGAPSDPLVYPDADELWTRRGRSGTVLDRRYGERVREDVGVPLDRLDELAGALGRIAEEFAVPLYVYGHLGQGNLHPNFVLDPASGAAGRLRRRLYEETYRLGGTIGAEHGLGIRKRAFLAHEVGGPAVALLQRIKDACDPDGILNPGKLLPDRAPG